MEDPSGLTAAEQGRAIAAGRLDPRELVEATLSAAEAHPDRARIFARLTPERARAEAGAAATRAREGRRAGPLDGIAVAWKDNVDTAGTVTEGGTRLLAGRVPQRDARVLATASAAGLVCVGKTHLSELAFSGLGVNPMTATPPNAHAPERAPGGSSSGTAVAVALGLAGAGVGTDTGGSVRIPAAWNGLVGLKTTHGLLSNAGVVPLAASLDTVGPITRTVEDARLMLEALSGTGVEAGEPALPPLQIADTIVTEGCDAEVDEAFAAACDRLGRAGADLSRGPVPEFAEALDIAARMSSLVTYEAWAEWGETIEANPGVMFPLIEARFRSGAAVEADADRLARAALAALRDRVSARMADRLLLMPAVACMPPETARLLADEDHYVERNLLALRNTRVANLLGLSALVVPVPERPMTALMLFAPPREEARLLAAGAALEHALGG